MRTLGINSFHIYPLEIIIFEDHPDAATRIKAFSTVADEREKFWIEYLRSWRPLGYNTIWSLRRKKCRHSRLNPAKRHRLRNQFPHPPPDTVLDVLEKRIYGYRNWERRSIFLLTTINKNQWEDSILDKYKNKNLKRIKDFILRCISLKYPIGLKNEVDLLLQKIRTKIDIPPTYSDPKRSICNPITITVDWNECMLQKIPVKRIIIEAQDLPITTPKQALHHTTSS